MRLLPEHNGVMEVFEIKKKRRGHCSLALKEQDWPEAPNQEPVKKVSVGGSEGDSHCPRIFDPRI